MLEVKKIYKTYRTNNGVTHRALHNVSLSFDDKGLVFIVGKSGGGKTTLLNIIGALDTADRGELILDGNSFKDFKSEDYDRYRNTHIGVVYQEYNLIPTLTIKDNVALPLRLQNNYTEERLNWALDALKISDLIERLPNQLSGGQSQRVAIARAIIKDPKIILADEPTGNLDNFAGKSVMNIFKKLSEDKLVIIVTHDRELAEELGDRIIEISDGKVIKDLKKEDHAIIQKVEMVGRSLLKIPMDSEVPDSILSEVNDILYSNDRDSYLINESNLLKVKSLNQQIKGAVEINPNNTESYFTQYRPSEVLKKDISFKQVKMPINAAFRIALNSFKFKKFKLLITILMLTASLFFGGLLANTTFYNKNQAITNTMTKDKIQNINITKSSQFMEESIFTEDDIAEILKHSSFAAKGYSAQMTLKYPTSKKNVPYLLFPNTFSGFVECDNLQNLGFNYLKGTTSPKELNDVAITKSIADDLLSMHYFENCTSYTDILDKQILLDDNYFKIVAIVTDSGMKHDNDVKTKLYVRTGFMEKRRNAKDMFYAKFDAFSKDTSTFSIRAITMEKNIKDIVLSTVPGEHKTDSVYITKNNYNSLFGTPDNPVDSFGELTETAIGKITEFNKTNLSGMLKSASDDKDVYHIFNGLEIKGVFDSPLFDIGYDGEYSLYLKNLVIVSDEIFEDYRAKMDKNNFMMVKTGKNKTQNKKLIKFCEKNEYNILSVVTDAYIGVPNEDKMISTIYKISFVASMLLACLLMYSFIKTSIKAESRQIGILRGLGARGRDAYVIFAIEGILMSTVALILCLTIHAIIPPMQAFSNFRYNGSHFYKSLFSPIMPLILIGLSVLMTALATIIPLFKLIKMSPMDAMYKGNNQK